MRLRTIGLMGGALVLLAGCATMPNETATASAPAIPQGTGYFAQPSTLPFQAPDFSKITDADYQPAIEQGLDIRRAEIAAIAASPAAPTFDNTIVAMERSGQMLTRARYAFSQMVAANTNDTLDAIDAATAPKIAAANDEINLNEALFARVKAVYDARASMSMTPEDAMLLETTYQDFVHAGALLTPAQKEQLRAINARSAELETAFSQRLTEATAAKAPIFDSAAELAGLPQADIDAAAKLAGEMGHSGKFALALINTTQQPALTSLTNRETRRRLFEASLNRTSGGDQYDTTAIIAELAELRARKAALFGEPDFASYTLYDSMVTEPEQALSFMRGFVPALAAAQTSEGDELAALAHKDGVTGPLQPWDWGYYAAKLRQARYSYDENALKPYLVVDRVEEDGVFLMANRLYGLTFKKRTDIPTYHPDVTVYTVYDKDGKELGLFYFDPYARPNKQGGAWMGNFVDQSHLFGLQPVVFNTLNVTKPQPGQPALMTWDDVTTAFHEFGHGLHGLFANQQYPSLSGSATARDFVEFPSQFHENFATVPEVFRNYAKHYQTGEVMPAALMDKVEAASKFDQGMAFGETLEAALLDMEWHALKPSDGRQDVNAFESAALGRLGMRTDLVPPRYRSSYFRHIWSNGYQAGYYSYLWTEMLAHDGYDWVVHNGGMTRAVGEHIRASFLGQGHSKDYGQMYRDFTGHDPQIGPMLEAKGLAPETK